MFDLIVEGKKALLVIAAMSLPALLPAGAASAASGERVLVYKITRASGYIRADFQGAQNDGCQARGVCGYNGVVAEPNSIGVALPLAVPETSVAVNSARWKLPLP